jgi:ectoine hydroxylase-related dioxygenase (phytanoyl-CoA dioxygenase family)
MNTKKLDNEFNLSDLYRNGFYVIKNCIDFREATYLSDLSRKLCSQNKEILSHHDNWQGLYNPFYLNNKFLEIIYNPKILYFVEKCLGQDSHPILNMQALFNSQKIEEGKKEEIINNALSRKNHKLSNCNIHTDQLFNNPFNSDSPLQICFLIALDNFNKKTGGTAFVNGSHLLDKPRPDKVNKLNLKKEDLLIPNLEPGDAVVFWGHTWHMAMPNTLTNNRYGLSLRYTHWAIKTMFDYKDYQIPDIKNNLEKELIESLLGKGCVTPSALDKRKFTVTAKSAINQKNIKELFSQSITN